MNWISVNEGLPPIEGKGYSFTQFCRVKSEEGEGVAYYHYRNKMWYTAKEPLNGVSYRPLYNVTQWQALSVAAE